MCTSHFLMQFSEFAGGHSIIYVIKYHKPETDSTDFKQRFILPFSAAIYIY